MLQFFLKTAELLKACHVLSFFKVKGAWFVILLYKVMTLAH